MCVWSGGPARRGEASARADKRENQHIESSYAEATASDKEGRCVEYRLNLKLVLLRYTGTSARQRACAWERRVVVVNLTPAITDFSLGA